MRRPALSLALIAAGAALFAAAGRSTGSTGLGGVFRVGLSGSSPQIDPQLGWTSTAWWLDNAVGARLFSYPDTRGSAGSVLRPEVASRFTVSHDGRTYTFFIRKGFRFSDGSPVTAASFAYAIDRALNHDLEGPAAGFVADPRGTEIVGAVRVSRGSVRHVSGVVVRGDRLVIHLVHPDGTFLSKITLPFFQATSRTLPLTHDVETPYPTAGPYAFARHVPGLETRLRRNPYYRGSRPRHLGSVVVRWSQNEQTAYQQVLANELDEAWVPSSSVQEAVDRFGVNKTRLWSEPVNCTGYLALNMSRPLFEDNLPLRQAVNYAIDRRSYIAQAGPAAGQPWTHLLNPGVPGWRDVRPYRHDLAKARKLAAGHFRSGKITLWYPGNSPANRAQGQVVRRDLIRLGFEPQNVEMVPIFFGIDNPLSRKGAPFDIATSLGWCSDSPDPYDLINVLLDGRTLGDELTVNYSRMNLPRWNRRMRAAARLVGPARYRAYGRLDLDIMRHVAPVAVERTYNAHYLFSSRVDPKSLVYQSVFADWSIPALALK